MKIGKRYWILALFALFAVNLDINAGSYVTGTSQFYGHSVKIGYDYQIRDLQLRSLNQSSLYQVVEGLRNANLSRTTQELKRLQTSYQLDDVGLTLLIDRFLESSMLEERKNERTLVKYVLLKDMGYDVLLTRSSGQLNCLANLSFEPGRYLYINYNRKVYKDLDFSKRRQSGKHFIFMDQKRAYTSLKRNPLQLPRLNAIKKSKAISFEHQGESHELQARSNQSLLMYLDDLPMHDIGNEYSRQAMSLDMEQSLITYLKQHTRGMNKAQKAHFLLAFVQQVVPYGSDYTKYGEEKYYYPEQTIMARTADCEDKTFLLAYLAREVAGIASVALYFEKDEHLSIGLQIPDFDDAYSFKYKGKAYVACEPTSNLPRLGKSGISLHRVTKVTEL